MSYEWAANQSKLQRAISKAKEGGVVSDETVKGAYIRLGGLVVSAPVAVSEPVKVEEIVKKVGGRRSKKAQ